MEFAGCTARHTQTWFVWSHSRIDFERKAGFLNFYRTNQQVAGRVVRGIDISTALYIFCEKSVLKYSSLDEETFDAGIALHARIAATTTATLSIAHHYTVRMIENSNSNTRYDL